jgi:hypothetical protein
MTEIKKIANGLLNVGKKWSTYALIIGGFLGGDYSTRQHTNLYSADVNSDGINDIIEISKNPLIFPKYSRVLISQIDGDNLKFIPYEDIIQNKIDSLENEIMRNKNIIDKKIENIAKGEYAK